MAKDWFETDSFILFLLLNATGQMRWSCFARMYSRTSMKLMVEMNSGSCDLSTICDLIFDPFEIRSTGGAATKARGKPETTKLIILVVHEGLAVMYKCSSQGVLRENLLCRSSRRVNDTMSQAENSVSVTPVPGIQEIDDEISISDIEQGIKHWNEATSTSPSGRHLGH
jgi:hypothetical protein